MTAGRQRRGDTRSVDGRSRAGRSRGSRAVIVVLGALLAAAGPVLGQLPPGPLFEDVSDLLGPDHEHVDAPIGFGMAGGAAWLDMDGDGDDDLLVTQGYGNHQLFENRSGEADSDGASAPVFVEVSERLPWPTEVISNFGVAVGDYDQDGLPDLLLTNQGPNQLLHNDGGGFFSDVTAELGVAGHGMSTSAAWADFDGDRDLDLYVGNYIAQLDFPYHVGARNELWINEGTAAAPLFVERAGELGVDGQTVFGEPYPLYPLGANPGAPTAGCTLSVCTLDYDRDGDPDLIVGNDFGMFTSPNRLYRNDGTPGRPLLFTDVSEESNIGRFSQYNMGINPCDYDHDGDWDLYLSDLGPNLLLRNDGGVFTDVTEQAGPVDGHGQTGLLLTSWGTVWTDVDNDGHEDLYVVNGFIPAADFISNEVRSPNHLWRSLGTGAFEQLPPELSGVDDEGVGRGVALGDFDADGLLDLYLMNNGNESFSFPEDAPRLYRNTGALVPDGGGHWLQLRLRGTRSNVEGLGTEVQALLAAGLDGAGDGAGMPVRLLRQLLADPVYLSASSRVLHFGLGANGRVDVLSLDWPSGTHQELHDVPVDRRLVLVEPRVVLDGELEAPQVVPGGLALAATLENLDAEPRPYRLELQLRAGHVTLFSSESRGVLGGGASRRLVATAPLAAAILEHLGQVGGSLHVTAHDSSDRTLDQRRLEFVLP